MRRPVTYLGTQQCKELQKISGVDFQNVLKYRFRCADAASNYLTSWKNMSGSQYIWEKHCISCSSSKVQRLDSANVSRPVALWWDKYLTKIVQDIQECTWEGELKDEDALCCYLQYKPRDCSCAPKVVVDVRTFLATLRSNLSACIQQVSLFPQFWLERFSLIVSSSLRFLLEVNEAPWDSGRRGTCGGDSLVRKFIIFPASCALSKLFIGLSATKICFRVLKESSI